MRKIGIGWVALLCCALLAGGCDRAEAAKKAPAGAGIPPVAWLASRVVGEPVSCALPIGKNPHDYAPSPAVMLQLAGAGLFFSTGQSFERNLGKALAASGTCVVDVLDGITRQPFGEQDYESHDDEYEHDDEFEHDHGHEHEHEHGSGGEALDPHLWTSPEKCAAIVANIRDALVLTDPARAETYRRNAETLLAELAAVKAEVAKKLEPCRGKTFFVYHPAFGYFASEFGLRQSGIELGGREPSPARLARVIAEAKEHRVRTVFVQPQFNPTAAETLAKAIGGEVAELDPLAPNVIENFRRIADTIAKGAVQP